MGYIEDRKAEGERQAFEAAKKAEIARVLNQGEPGLASRSAEPYVSGISQEDAYKLALARQAAAKNYNRDLEGMRTAPVVNGKIDPRYWEMAQRASDYELANGLAVSGAR